MELKEGPVAFLNSKRVPWHASSIIKFKEIGVYAYVVPAYVYLVCVLECVFVCVGGSVDIIGEYLRQ